MVVDFGECSGYEDIGGVVSEIQDLIDNVGDYKGRRCER